MLKLESPADYYREMEMAARSQNQHVKVTPKQVESVVHGMMHTHLDSVRPELSHDNVNCPCRRPDITTVDSPEGQAKILRSLLALKNQQTFTHAHEPEFQRDHEGSVSGESISDHEHRTSSPMSVGSRSGSFSRVIRPTHSSSPSTVSSASSGDMVKSKLYNMLRNNANNDYAYPSPASATNGVGPFINTPPSYYQHGRSSSFSHPQGHSRQPDMYPSRSLVNRQEYSCYTPPPPEAQQEQNFRKRSYSATVPRTQRLHEESPIDLSFKKPKTKRHLELPETSRLCYSQPCSPGSPNDSESEQNSSDSNTSILRSILCGRLNRREETEEQRNGSVCFPHSEVRLAKKILLPASARISDWLVKLVEFACALPGFSDKPQGDKISLIQDSWSRIVLLYMAETNFQFVVAPKGSDGTETPGSPTAAREDPTIPTMQRVENIQKFISKCHSLDLDTDEYECLRILTLFYNGSKVSCTRYADSMSDEVRQRLQQHARIKGSSIRYSQLLLLLPALLNVNPLMMERLFCKHITTSTGLYQLLTDLINKT